MKILFLIGIDVLIDVGVDLCSRKRRNKISVHHKTEDIVEVRQSNHAFFYALCRLSEINGRSRLHESRPIVIDVHAEYIVASVIDDLELHGIMISIINGKACGRERSLRSLEVCTHRKVFARIVEQHSIIRARGGNLSYNLTCIVGIYKPVAFIGLHRYILVVVAAVHDDFLHQRTRRPEHRLQ